MHHVTLRDVSLRDGLQALPEILPAADKLAVLDALLAAGIDDLQLTSFVNPARVPQLADADIVYQAALSRGLVPNILVANMRGFERALAAGVQSVDAVMSVSTAYNTKNAHRTPEESTAEIDQMLERGGPDLGVCVANCFHCFTEGAIPPEKPLAMVEHFARRGARFLWLADTTGHAYPDQVKALMLAAAEYGVELGLHLHDTEGRAVDNALAAYEAGVRRFDVALGGLGGSPFTPGVGGNLGLEKAHAAFTAAGISTGLDTALLAAANQRLADAIVAARK